MKAEEAVSLIKDGDTVVVATFYSVGLALDLVNALAHQGTKNLNIITNDAGIEGVGTGLLIKNEQISELTCSYVGTNAEAERLAAIGKLKVELISQGTLIEKLRATGAGIGAFFTPTGVGTIFEKGKERRMINKRTYILEKAFYPKPKFAFVKAWKADKWGNLVFRGTARNFNPVVATAAEVVIVEAENIVEVGEINPNDVMLPSGFAKILVQSSGKKIRPWLFKEKKVGGVVDDKRIAIAKRAAQELKDGDIVNLGIGIPTMVANYIPSGISVRLQAENGILGVGPAPAPGEEDSDIVDAGGNSVTVMPGGAFFDSAMSFVMIRGGHVDLTILGALEVDQHGNLANWTIPSKRMPGVGGGMELAVGAKRVIVVTEHTTNKGQPKIVERCFLPLTAKGVVDLIITELAVMEPTDKGLVLKELAPGKTLEEVQALTGAKLIVEGDI